MRRTVDKRRGHRGSWLLLAGAAAIALVGCRFLSSFPEARTPQERQGRHLLQIAEGCGCHGANFAGWRPGGPDNLPRSLPYGERFTGPFGAVPAPNITPDRETGIGGWSDAQIERAIRDGVDHEGHTLFPIMPW
jgi:hypothetical protein